MNTRQARKILRNPVPSNKLREKLRKMYPPFITERGTTAYPSWHKYYRFSKAWHVVRRKIHKYGDRFILL